MSIPQATAVLSNNVQAATAELLILATGLADAFGLEGPMPQQHPTCLAESLTNFTDALAGAADVFAELGDLFSVFNTPAGQEEEDDDLAEVEVPVNDVRQADTIPTVIQGQSPAIEQQEEPAPFDTAEVVQARQEEDDRLGEEILDPVNVVPHDLYSIPQADGIPEPVGATTNGFHDEPVKGRGKGRKRRS